MPKPSSSSCWIKCGSGGRTDGGSYLLGIAKTNFDQDQPHRLPLIVGDAVILLMENKNWYYGCIKKNTSHLGIFPKSYVQQVDVEVRNSGEYVVRRSQFVRDITMVLIGWRDRYKEYYLSSSSDSMQELRNVTEELILRRSQVITDHLTADEMRETKCLAIQALDIGNNLLGLDMIVRDESGDVLDIRRTSTLQLYRQHINTAARIEIYNEKKSRAHVDAEQQWKNPNLPAVKRVTQNLMLSLKSFNCKLDEVTDAMFTLYDGDTLKALHEVYLHKWERNVGGKLNAEPNCEVVFTDLNPELIATRTILLVCKAVQTPTQSVQGRRSYLPSSWSPPIGPFRRPFGVAFCDLTDILRNYPNNQFPMQLEMPFFTQVERESLDATLRQLIASINSGGRTSAKITISLDLVNAGCSQVKQNPKTQVIARKMSFPDVILPEEVRNDLYLTLTEGDFTHASKSVETGVEVLVAVYNEVGNKVAGAISVGAGSAPVSEYRSLIYCYDERPKWNETIRIQISVENFRRCHLMFTFKHLFSNKDGFAYLSLMQANETALQNQQHKLVVYKIAHRKLKDYVAPPSYYSQVLASNPKTAASKHSITIETNLCSTKLTQDVHLLSLLNYAADKRPIESTLRALHEVSHEEVVRVLQDILDSLFDILSDSRPTVDILVFDGLLKLIDIVHDKKYQNFLPVLDRYIDKSFSSTLAYIKLASILQTQIEQDLREKNDGSLFRRIRHLEYIFKFINRSQVLHVTLDDNLYHRERFEESIRGLLQLLVTVVATTEMIRSQSAILKCLHIFVNDVMQVYCPIQLSKFVTDVLDYSRVAVLQRMCIRNLVNSNLFHVNDCRIMLLPVFCQCIKNKLLDLTMEMEEVGHYLDIINNMLDQLFNNPLVTCTDDDIILIVNSLLRIIIQMTTRIITDSPNVSYLHSHVQIPETNCFTRKLVMAILGIFRIMKINHYQMYVRFQAGSEIIVECLSAFEHFVSSPVFPAKWVDMIMHQNTVILESLHQFKNIILSMFYTHFERSVWLKFFRCAIAFIAQPSLQFETGTPCNKKTAKQKRNELLRRPMADDIRCLWHGLREYRADFAGLLVEPFVQISLIADHELREIIIPIFFEMMHAEWFRSADDDRTSVNGSFAKFERALIGHLDHLVTGGHGDDEYRCAFERIMLGLCQADSTLCEPGVRFVQTVGELMVRLLDYRTTCNGDSKENHMSCAAAMLEFYRQNANCSELAVPYINQLFALHISLKNTTEAAFTLRLAADFVEWSDAELPEMLRDSIGSSCRTHRQVSLHLYNNAMGLFDVAQLWECALDVGKQLAHEYEHHLMDYVLLSATHTKLAELYRKIIKEKRHECQYFRVVFYGLGFPKFRQNKEFVYRGEQYEKLGTFYERMLNEYQGAKRLDSMEVPGVEITQSSGKYLLINSVMAIAEEKFGQNSKKRVDRAVSWYYQTNDVRRFQFSRPFKLPAEDGSDNSGIYYLWQKRSVMVTCQKLPGVLPWVEVLKTEVHEISSLQHAIETMELTNREVYDLVKEHIPHNELDCKDLNRKVNGIINADIMGGIQMYEEAFFTDTYLKRHPEDGHDVMLLKSLIADQIPLLDVALRVLRAKVPLELEPLQDRLEDRFAEIRASVEQKFGKRGTDLLFELKRGPSVRRLMAAGTALGSGILVRAPMLNSRSESNEDQANGCNISKHKYLVCIQHIRNKSHLGIFPKSYVQQVDVEVRNSGEYVVRRSQFVRDITMVLNDWRDRYKDYYLSSSSDSMQELRNVTEELILRRSQIITDHLTADEMRKTKCLAIKALDIGNDLLGLDMIVRDESGDVLDIRGTSTLQLYRQHIKTATRINIYNKTKSRELDVDADRSKNTKNVTAVERETLNLVLRLISYDCKLNKITETMFTLYDGDTLRPIHELYLHKLKRNNGGKMNAEHNFDVVFTDLNPELIDTRNIFLVCKAVQNASETPPVRYNILCRNEPTPVGLHRVPFGVAFCDLTDILKNYKDKQFPMQMDMPFLPQSKNESLDATLRQLIESMGNGGRTTAKMTIFVDLVNAVTDQIKQNPDNQVVARKMSFPDVDFHMEVRNDLYLTLVEGDFQHASKSGETGVEVSVSVYNDLGNQVSGAILVGAGRAPVSEYRSLVYYCDERPQWNETILIQISVENFRRCHLLFTFKLLASRTNGFAYLSLMQANETALQNQLHELVVYKIVHRKLQKKNYLSPISHYSQMIASSSNPTSTRHSITIETNLCSTKLTQDVHLLSLLNYATYKQKRPIESMLRALHEVSHEEVVRVLHEILQSLFDILNESRTEAVDALVFDGLLKLIEIVHNKKYQNFRPVLDRYIDNRFSSKLTCTKLTSFLQKLIERNLREKNDCILFRLIRHLEYIGKFIVKSHILKLASDEIVHNRTEFEESIRKLLQLLVSVVATTEMIQSQGAILKCLHKFVKDLMQVYCPIKLSIFVNELLNLSRVSVIQMVCLRNLALSDLFHVNECRIICLPVIFQCIKTKLLEIKVQEVGHYLDIINNMLDQLFNNPLVTCTDDDIILIVNSLLRIIIQMTTRIITDSPNVSYLHPHVQIPETNCKLLMALLGIFRIMKINHYQMYVRFQAGSEIIVECLSVFEHFVSSPIFPAKWVDMIMHQNIVILDSLHQFKNIILSMFYTHFDRSVWLKFFRCAIAFIAQPSLQFETDTTCNKKTAKQKRNELLRRPMADDIRSLWHGLREYRADFAGLLVEPFVQISLIADHELREIIIPIFFEMMHAEWFRSADDDRSKVNSSFAKFERALIGHLDHLVKSGHGDDEYRCAFERIMLGLCQADSTLCEPGVRFVQTVGELMVQLLDYRTTCKSDSKENQMSCAAAMIAFYQQNANYSELTIQYINQLYALHISLKNTTEAAFTLRLAADFVEWSDADLPEVLRDIFGRDHHTHRQLKRLLCNMTMGLFGLAKLWECAREVGKELAHEYEHGMMDNELLAATYTKLSNFSKLIQKKNRLDCQYFRVVFYGLGFPKFRQNKEFVYRGVHYEKLGTFYDRMLNEYQGAKRLNSMEAPGVDITESSGKYLLINSVIPIAEKEFIQKSTEQMDVALSWYHRTNEVRHFQFSRPFKLPAEDGSDNTGIYYLWLKRSLMETRQSLPGILPWVEVVKTEVFDISSLQHAIETMELNNQEIYDLVKEHISHNELDCKDLNRKVNGIINADIMGGIQMYEEAFLTDTYLERHPEDGHDVMLLKSLIAVQMPLLEDALRVLRAKVPLELEPLQDQMENRFAETRAHVERKFGKRDTDLKF